MFEGDLTQIKSVLGTFFDLGGQQVNLSVVCQKDLEDALVHPESHENLVVRVGGFTARFIDLDKKNAAGRPDEDGILLREKSEWHRYCCAVSENKICPVSLRSAVMPERRI